MHEKLNEFIEYKEVLIQSNKIIHGKLQKTLQESRISMNSIS
jgi:hypothetical protein